MWGADRKGPDALLRFLSCGLGFLKALLPLVSWPSWPVRLTGFVRTCTGCVLLCCVPRLAWSPYLEE